MKLFQFYHSTFMTCLKVWLSDLYFGLALFFFNMTPPKTFTVHEQVASVYALFDPPNNVYSPFCFLLGVFFFPKRIYSAWLLIMNSSV